MKNRRLYVFAPLIFVALIMTVACASTGKSDRKRTSKKAINRHLNDLTVTTGALGMLSRKEYNKLVDFTTKQIESGKLGGCLPDVYYLRGIGHRNLKNYDKALADFSKTIDLDPNDWDAIYQRSFIYEEFGQIDLAISDMENALSLYNNLSSFDNQDSDKPIVNTRCLKTKPNSNLQNNIEKRLNELKNK